MDEQIVQSTTGVLTFLFSDIEGSSRRWESAPEAMRASVNVHNAVLEKAVEESHGRVFKRVGDEFCCVFERPADAVTAAVDIQRGLANAAWPDTIEPLRVRIGIHAGTALAIEERDFAGPALNRTARVMAAGHGGQALISGSAANLVREGLPEGVSLRNLGTHRLRDLSHEEALYQIVAGEMPDVSAKIRTLDTHPNNLPSQISSFVGRAEDIRRTLESLQQHRLVTIAGPGGIGKTRLGLQVASEVLPAYEGGCWLIALADIREPALVVPAIASVLQVEEEPGRPIVETLSAHLRDKRILLLLDNSEHLLASVAQTIARLSAECSGAAFLVTSREPTHVAGERVVRIDPLDPGDAVELFFQRAQSAGGSIDASANDAVENICRQLDGIPLAIELAAARTQTLLPQDLAQALQRRPGLLVSKDPLGAPRHRTLSATIEWSFTLLNEGEQKVLLRLSIFDGGFTASAAEEVAYDESEPELFVDVLDSLVDKSFVRAIRSGSSMRYRMLDPIRSFLLGRLDDNSASSAAQRHFAFFKRLASNWNLQKTGSVTVSEVEAELPNLRAALSWAFEQPVLSPAVELLIALTDFWQFRGNVAEARDWLRHAVDRKGYTPVERAAVLRRAATFASKLDDYEVARRLIQDAREIYESLDDTAGIAETLHALAIVENFTGNFDAAFDLYGRALKGFDASGHDHGKITSLTNRAIILAQRDEHDAAREAFNMAQQICRDSGRTDDLSSVLTAYAALEVHLDNVQDAQSLLKEALDLKRRMSGRENLTDVLANLALLNARENDLPRALEYAAEELQVAIEDGGNALLLPTFEVVSFLLYKTGEHARAASLFGFTARARERSNYRIGSRLTNPEIEEITSEPAYTAAIAAKDERQPIDVALELLENPPRTNAVTA